MLIRSTPTKEGITTMFPTINDGTACGGCGETVRHSETFGTVADHLPDCPYER